MCRVGEYAVLGYLRTRTENHRLNLLYLGFSSVLILDPKRCVFTISPYFTMSQIRFVHLMRTQNKLIIKNVKIYFKIVDLFQKYIILN